MKKAIIIVFLLGLVCNLYSQSENKKQEILELNNSELQKLGITIKDKQIIYNNDIVGVETFQLSQTGNSYSPFLDDIKDIPATNFDFYPYYITNTDSVWGFMWISDEENELKDDPIYVRKMMNEYLVPVRIKQADDNEKWGDDMLYWFTPTRSFCEAIPERCKIEQDIYTSDSLITSDVALFISDKYLKNIGFEMDEDGISINTFKKGKDKYKISEGTVVSWYNTKTECGSSVMSGNQKKIKEIFKDNEDLMNADYYIVKVSFVDGSDNLSTGYKGRAIPFYIRNYYRNLNCKKDVIIYLKYTQELADKLPKRCNWYKMPDVYTVILN